MNYQLVMNITENNRLFLWLCSGHTMKLQVINSLSLAIFTFSPCQRGVNRPRANTQFQPK